MSDSSDIDSEHPVQTPRRSRRWRWFFLGFAAVVLGLGLILGLVLPMLVDANRYRGRIEKEAEKYLGRDVRLGEMSLAVLPSLALEVQDFAVAGAPGEEADLLAARRLRVGARLLPLLSKRLEVTSVVLEEPRLFLRRDAEGQWNVEDLWAEKDASAEASPEKGEDGSFSLDLLRLKGAEITLGDAAWTPGETVVWHLREVDLALRGLEPGGTVDLEVALTPGPEGAGRVELAGSLGPVLVEGSGGYEPVEIDGSLDLNSVALEPLARLAEAAGVDLRGLVSDPTLSLEARFKASLGGADPSLAVESLRASGLHLALERGGRGEWTFWTKPAPQENPESPAAELRVAVHEVVLEKMELAYRDASTGAALALEGLRLELRDLVPGRKARLEVEGRLAVGETPAGLKPGTFRAAVDLGPWQNPSGAPLTVAGELILTEISGASLEPLEPTLGVPIGEILGSSPFSAEVQGSATLGNAAAGRLDLLKVRGLAATLRRDGAGRWNFEARPSAADTKKAAGSTGSGAGSVRLGRIEVSETRLRIVDAEVPGSPATVTLTGLELSLDAPSAPGSPARLSMAAKVDGGGSVKASGELAFEEATKAAAKRDPEATIRIPGLEMQLAALPLAVLRPWLAQDLPLEPGRGTVDATAKLQGRWPSSLGAVGDLAVSDARLNLLQPDGSPKALPLDLQMAFDLVAKDSGDTLELKAVGVELGGDFKGSKLALRGSVVTEGEGRRLDLTLAPARLPVDAFRSLAALAIGELPVTIETAEPVELEGRLQGLLAEGSTPQVNGRLGLRQATVALPGARRPVEGVQATLRFGGGGLEVADFSGRVGGSDLAGQIAVADLADSAVTFVLTSGKLDFLEVLEALPGPGEAEAAEGASADPAEPGPPLDGKLRVSAGKLENLDVSDFKADLKLAGDRLVLAPVTMNLYGGRFEGRGEADLSQKELGFRFDGTVEGVQVDDFLADNLDLGGMLFGAFSGDVAATGSGLEAERLLQTLQGAGSARVQDGHLGKLDVLASLSRVSGVFGEKSLARLTRQLATQGTDFSSLKGDYRLEAGHLRMPEVQLQSPDFDLTGGVGVDLGRLTLDGAFTVTFSQAVSRAMYEEGSRAGELFWDPQLARVVVPLALSGPMEAPEASIDWKAAVQTTVRREVGKTLTGLLEQALGGKEGRRGEGAGPSATGSGPGSEGPTSEPVGNALRAEISEVRWGGNLLIRDLKIRGFVSGAELEQASLEVVDARGGVVQRWEQLGQLLQHLASAADPAAAAKVPWDSTFKGKDLLSTRFPLTVTLTVRSSSGLEARDVRTVER